MAEKLSPGSRVQVQPGSRPLGLRPREDDWHKLKLNSNLTFESFIVGPSNEYAYSIAKAVANSRGSALRFGCIYGATGNGKTHLLQAIGNHFSKVNPTAKVAFLPIDRFISDMAQASQTNRLDELRAYYRSQDALLIDDMQLIKCESNLQEELYFTIRDLLESNKRVIFTCDSSPNDFGEVESKLRLLLHTGGVISMEQSAPIFPFQARTGPGLPTPRAGRCRT